MVETPDVRATMKRGTVPHPPLTFRGPDGTYRGRIVLALMVDTTGHVVPGSVSVADSTDPRLSHWGCTIAEQLQYLPATFNGKPVLTMVDQPLAYSYGEPPPELKKP